MEIHPSAIASFNEKAEEFLSLVERRKLGPGDDIAATVRKRNIISSEENAFLDKRVFSEEGVGVFYLIDNEWIGLNDENTGKYGQLIYSILKRKEVNPIISFYRLKDICISWLINSYLQKEGRTLMQYLKDAVEKEIGNYQIFYRIENLRISQGFNIGPVWFGSFTSEKLNDTLSFLNREKHGDLIKLAKQRFENITIVTYVAKEVEITKARELTKMFCSTAVNVLKIFSPTLFSPRVRCDFDLDFLLKGDPKSEEFSIKYSKEKKPLVANLHFNRKSYELLEIDDEYLDFMKEKGMGNFHDFLCNPKGTELCELIVKTIDLFGAALSVDNLHLRIINLFTISEFLLLKGNDIPILDSLKKYFPILISEDKNERSEIKRILTSLYSVRSSAIHHGIYKDFQLQDLSKFQWYLFSMLKKLISLSKVYDTKDEVLEEIDDSIAGLNWKPGKSIV